MLLCCCYLIPSLVEHGVPCEQHPQPTRPSKQTHHLIAISKDSRSHRIAGYLCASLATRAHHAQSTPFANRN